jgi:hypothetical protein
MSSPVITSTVYRARLPAAAFLTIAAVLVSGVWASVAVSPVVFPPTLVIVWVLVRAALGDRAAWTPSVIAEGSDYADLPEPLRATVIEALARLPDGDARKLLVGVIVQCRPILSTQSVALDAAREAETRANVVALVGACCATAIELAQVDAAAASSSTANAELAAKSSAARALLVERLSGATDSLTSLYLAGLGADSSAATRVASLVREIRLDADGRQAASTELAALLGDRPAG